MPKKGPKNKPGLVSRPYFIVFFCLKFPGFWDRWWKSPELASIFASFCPKIRSELCAQNRKKTLVIGSYKLNAKWDFFYSLNVWPCFCCRTPSSWSPRAGVRGLKTNPTSFRPWTPTEWLDVSVTRKTPTSSLCGSTRALPSGASAVTGSSLKYMKPQAKKRWIFRFKDFDFIN